MKYCRIINEDLNKCDLSSKKPGKIDVRKEFSYCPDCGAYIGHEPGPNDPKLTHMSIIEVWNLNYNNRFVRYYRGGPVGFLNYRIIESGKEAANG